MARAPRVVMHGLAGSIAQRGLSARRIPVTGQPQFWQPVTRELFNDGIAPQATFSGAGVAQAQVGPQGLGETWSLDQCFLSTSVGQFDAAQCTVFLGPLPIAQLAVTGSLQGGSSQFGLGGTSLRVGDFVIAVWTGGTAGAFANLRVTGVKTALAS